MSEHFSQQTTPTPPAKPNRIRRTQSDWTILIKEWEASKQSQKDFCKDRGLCYRNFNQWKSRIKKQSTPALASEMPDFVALRVSDAPSAPTSSTFSVHLPGDIRLSIEGDIHSAASLIKALSTPLC